MLVSFKKGRSTIGLPSIVWFKWKHVSEVLCVRWLSSVVRQAWLVPALNLVRLALPSCWWPHVPRTQRLTRTLLGYGIFCFGLERLV